MSIWNKILVGVICVASLVLFYMAARTLKTHQYWHELALKHQRQIEQVQEQNHQLVEGGDGIRQRRIELNKLLLDRGRVWFRCDPKVKLNRQDGSAVVTVAIGNPDPHGIAENTILYGFEEADVRKNGRYLGEFKVTKADEKQKTVVLIPTLPLSPRQIDRLATAQRPWVLYEVLPRDNHDILASLNDKEKETMLPRESLPEYLNDGKPAAKDEPAERVADGKYIRPLRDYQVLFSVQNLHRTLLVDQIDATTRDKKLVDDALAQAQQQEEAATKDVVAAKEEVKTVTHQRDAVAVYLKTLGQEFEAVKAAITRLIENNKAMAGQIAKLQLEAARRIDQRTRAMAQSGAGNSGVNIYDRDYYRQEQRPGISSYTPRTIVVAIIAVNVAVWLADFLTPETPGHGRWLSDQMAVHVDTLTHPWLWWQYLTAGFAHSPRSFDHILFNMLGLYFLGRDVEETYGPKEFWLYLMMVVFASVVWNVANKIGGTPDWVGAYGASGAIAGVVVLYALNFPHRTLLLFFVIPMPAWLLGVLFVGLDIYGASVRGGASNVAYSMHLAGAAFALIYYQRGWNLTRLTSGRITWPSFGRKPRLRIHTPEEEPQPDLSAEVDRILEKIYREGEAGLTAKERKTLETASREYQKRKG